MGSKLPLPQRGQGRLGALRGPGLECRQQYFGRWPPQACRDCCSCAACPSVFYQRGSGLRARDFGADCEPRDQLRPPESAQNPPPGSHHAGGSNRVSGKLNYINKNNGDFLIVMTQHHKCKSYQSRLSWSFYRESQAGLAKRGAIPEPPSNFARFCARLKTAVWTVWAA